MLCIVTQRSFKSNNWTAPWRNRIFMFHNYETEKITGTASDAAENPQLYRGVQFFRPRSSCTRHLMLFSERPSIYASLCIMISDGRTKQLYIIAGFLPRHWLYECFSSAENIRRYMRRAWQPRVKEPNNTL